MKISRSLLQLLQLLLLLLRRRTHGWQCKFMEDTADPKDWNKKIMEQVDTLFNGTMCGPDGLQWTCYISRRCSHGDRDRNPLDLTTAYAEELQKYSSCPAVFAIQARTNNQWRVVMQAKEVPPQKHLLFKANCIGQFKCSYQGGTVKGESRFNGFFENPTELRGRYEDSTRTLMCDFVISSPGKSEIQLSTSEDEILTGIVTPNGAGEGYLKSAEIRRRAISKLEGGCQLNMIRTLPKANDDEEYLPVNIDYRNFSCPDSYSMRWRDYEQVTNNEKPFHTTPSMFCDRTIKVVGADGETASRTAQLEVHCARKKCKLCEAPTCANPAACPQLVKSADFDTCSQLKCQDEQHLLKFGGQVQPGNAVCKGVKWFVGTKEVQNVECAKVSCPGARETIKTKDAEKFNFTESRVVCMSDAEDIKYADGKDKGRMTAIVCNYSVGGIWYEEWKDAELATPEPYKIEPIDCYVQDQAQPATGNVLLYTGIGLGVLAAIIGVILAICFFVNRQTKRKAREAALKKATKGSKSMESKLLSPAGTKSTTHSRVTSTRSVTGNMKKKTGGKGGKTPEDNTPEERSRPVNRSSIVDTAELKKIEEERRKTAAATAALLESSKVEDEPQPVPATGAGSGEVHVEISKGSASLIPDATQQPDTVDGPPKQKPMQKKRIKKSKILENTDFTQQATTTVDKTQMPSTQAVSSMAVSRTQLGGPESDDEPEQPMWHNQPPAMPAAAAAKKEAVASDRQKIADLPTAKKKESSKKKKSGKRTPSAEKVVRPNFLNDTSDWEADFSSDKKKTTGGSNEEGGGSKESEKDERSKRTQQRVWAQKISKRIDPTQHIPAAGNDSAEENN